MARKDLVRWGIIGPGTIARTFAAALPHSETGRLVAIASRDPSRKGVRTGFGRQFFDFAERSA